jgi:GTP:adenosylcobinamide-phosphate guanylyltransferase
MEKFVANCADINVYQSSITKEINFLSILPDFQKNHFSKIWDEDNQSYVLAVNTPEELEQAEKLL